MCAEVPRAAAGRGVAIVALLLAARLAIRTLESPVGEYST
jgi:hypothetical protein